MTCRGFRVLLALLTGVGTGLAVVGRRITEAGAQQAEVVIATFDDPKLNAVTRNTEGGSFSSWCPSASASCGQEFVAEDALGTPGGWSLKLTYSVIPMPHFNGWYAFLGPDEANGVDLSAYDRVGFFVKGTTSFTMEVKDHTSRDDGSPGGVAEYVVTGVGSGWTRVEIPFWMFRPKDRETVIDWGGIRQLVIVFSDMCSEWEGWIMLDHLYVAKGTPSF